MLLVTQVQNWLHLCLFYKAYRLQFLRFGHKKKRDHFDYATIDLKDKEDDFYPWLRFNEEANFYLVA